MKNLLPENAGSELIEIPVAETKYLDVRGNLEEVPTSLRNLLISLEDSSADSVELDTDYRNEFLTLAGNEIYEAKLSELIDSESTSYTIAEFDESYLGHHSLIIVRQLLPYLESIGISGTVSDNGGELNFPTVGYIAFDIDGKIQICDDSRLIDKDIFHYLSCHISQDLAVVVRRNNQFIYASDISRFEKTPKSKEGKNAFLGADIIEFHSVAPNFGSQLGYLFQKIIESFETGKLGMLVVDLYGQNIFKDEEGNAIHRFERDKFIPLKGDNGELLGFIGVADVFFQNVEEKLSPYEGGEYSITPITQLDIQTKDFSKRVAEITSDNLVEELLDEGITSERKIQIVQKILNNKDQYQDEVLEISAKLNRERFGGRLNLYGISYISDKCVNDCTYCGHHAQLRTDRDTLTEEEMRLDFSVVLNNKPDEFCILAGEYPGGIEDYCQALRVLNTIDDETGNSLQRISLNVAPLSEDGFKTLVAAHSGKIPLQYRLFQETYDQEQYAKYHKKGPKKDFQFRAEAQDRALKAGFDEVGLGVLMGLNTRNNPYLNFGHDFEILSLIRHAYKLKEDHGKFPSGISIPRHQPVSGYSFETPNPIDDDLYVFYHALLKLVLPETKLIITSRETQELIQRVEPYVNIRDLAPRPGVGGNYRSSTNFQNELGDARSAAEIIKDLKERLLL